MKKKYPWLLWLAVVVLFSCKKDITELPPVTQSGANTFGCKVDGKLWAPAGFGIIPTAPILEARLMPGWDLIINARNFSSSPRETEFELFIKGVTATGSYPLNSNVSYPTLTASYGYYVLRKFTPLNEWLTSSQYTGTVNITAIDTINNFVSGTFEFRAISLYDASQVLQVTEGRFDVRVQ